MLPDQTPTGATSTPPAGRDNGTYGGMLVVAVAAAVLSFSALSGLAGLAGVTVTVPLSEWVFRLAWLLPIAVDAYAVTATRVWLRTAGTDRTRRYARRNAIGAIALSVAGNAAFHALDAAGVVSLADVPFGWTVIVAVSAVPPVLLGLVGHLHALVSDDHRSTVPTSPGPVVTVVEELHDFLTAHPAPAAQPAPTGQPIPAAQVTPGTGDTPETPAPAARPSRTRAAARPGTAEAVARLRRRHPDLPSVEVARRLGVSDRTVRRHLAATRTETGAETNSVTAAPADIRTDPDADAAPVAA